MDMNETPNQIILNNICYGLVELEKDCWNRLVNGAIKSRDPFHTPCVATQNNSELSMRTVVLRNTLPEVRQLNFHTDIRSEKWRELKKNNTISALFYDAAARIQLRIKGKAILHVDNEITSHAWQKTTLSSRQCYLTEFSPSSFSEIPTSGLPVWIEQENYSLEESEIGQQNFGIVSIQVESIDWLWLNHAGHRRAFFDYVKDRYQWMIP
jgi:pyridoxamine 5'-phosphate oxidase